MTIASISGIRGIFNQDLLPADICTYVENFAKLASAQEVLVGRDTRSTGSIIARLASSTLLGSGRDVIDYGAISTPALFRESRVRKAPALMVTASHNEPEWNGLKFILEGRGIVQGELARIMASKRDKIAPFSSGRLSHQERSCYNSELVAAAGNRSCEGIRVVLDINGGAAVGHAPTILEELGCELTVLGGTPGLFSRIVDPTNDPLELLTKTVKEKKADVGFAFDCDGDRLVIVDHEGRKKTGDYMLTLALMEMLPSLPVRSVVVSTDTTMAVDDIVSGLGGTVYRSRVGEANVILEMLDRGVRLGGEGSSGGLIDSDFNRCRDSMTAAITVVKALKKRGTKIFGLVPSYNIARVKLEIDRKKAAAAIKRLRKDYSEADELDGIKIRPSAHSWVLVRPSGTEDAVRISAEARSAKEAQELADSFMTKVKRLAA